MRGTNERMGSKPKAQENNSKLIRARKTLEKRDRVLMAAIRRCHFELAKRESLRDIEASKDAVEAAWKEFNHANARYCARAGWGPPFEEEEQPEEARRALYEWKVLTDMMEQVVDKAEEYLESATKENSWGELYEDEDCGNELNDYGDDGGDPDAEVRLWAEQLSTMSKVNEMVLEMSAANEVNNVDEVNVDEVNVDEVNVDEVKFDVNTEAKEVCGVKEEMSKGKSLEIEAKVEVKEESEELVTAKPPDVLLRFDSTAKVQVEECGMKEVMQIDDLKMKKESRHASWDPGEPVNAKAQTEMLDAKEEKILVNNDKVGLQMFMKEVWSSGGAIEKALLIVMFMLKERFVNSFSPLSVIQLSDYG